MISVALFNRLFQVGVQGTLSWDSHQASIQQSLQAAPVQPVGNNQAGLANSEPSTRAISSSISEALRPTLKFNLILPKST